MWAGAMQVWVQSEKQRPGITETTREEAMDNSISIGIKVAVGTECPYTGGEYLQGPAGIGRLGSS
jgi:hypothetical protein